MIRVLVINLLLFLLPFLLYAAWRWLVRGERNGRQMVSDAPLFVLMGLGLTLVAIGLFTLASYEETGIEGRYVPPAIKDGRIEPGHFEMPEK
jgi:hypothetical protein